MQHVPATLGRWLALAPAGALPRHLARGPAAARGAGPGSGAAGAARGGRDVAGGHLPLGRGAPVRAAGPGGAGRLRADGRGGAAGGGHRPPAGWHCAGHRAGRGAHHRAGRGADPRAAVAALRAAAQRTAGCARRGRPRCGAPSTGSWNLLEPAERAALAQCSVFRGGFTLEAAEAVLVLPARTARTCWKSSSRCAPSRCCGRAPRGLPRGAAPGHVREHPRVRLGAAGGARRRRRRWRRGTRTATWGCARLQRAVLRAAAAWRRCAGSRWSARTCWPCVTTRWRCGPRPRVAGPGAGARWWRWSRT